MVEHAAVSKTPELVFHGVQSVVILINYKSFVIYHILSILVHQCNLRSIGCQVTRLVSGYRINLISFSGFGSPSLAKHTVVLAAAIYVEPYASLVWFMPLSRDRKNRLSWRSDFWSNAAVLAVPV